MANSNSTATSMHKARILTSKMYEDKVEAILYWQIVGKLIYLTNNKPNITFATNILSRFMPAPQRPHMEAAKYMLRHLRGTSDLGILFKENTLDNVEGYTKSNWAEDNEGRCSHCGWSTNSIEQLKTTNGGPQLHIS